jgi:hypothetical protein
MTEGYEEEIGRRFGNRGFKSGGQLLYEIPTARDVVAFCATREIAVVGLEGFVVSEGNVRPLLDYIASWDDVPRHPWAEYVKKCQEYAARTLDLWAGTAPDGFRVRVAMASEQEIASLRRNPRHS